MEHYSIESTSVNARVERRNAALSKAARVMASGIVAVNLAIIVMCGVGAVEGKGSVAGEASIHSVDYYRGIQSGVYVVPEDSTRIADALIAAGWRGDPTDGAEALYSPAFSHDS